MPRTVNPKDALSLARALELTKTLSKGIEPSCDGSGAIIPSEESLQEINQTYIISDKVPPRL